MSRGYRNEGFELDQFSSRERANEGSLPGHVYDSYYQDSKHGIFANEEDHRFTRDQQNSNRRHDPRSDPRLSDHRDHRPIHGRNGDDVDELESRFQKYDSRSENYDRPQSRHYVEKPDQRNRHRPTEDSERWSEMSKSRFDDYRRNIETPGAIYPSLNLYREGEDTNSNDSPSKSFRGPGSKNRSSYGDRNYHEHQNPHGNPDHPGDIHQPQEYSGWNNVMSKMPSHMDRSQGTLRFPGTVSNVMASLLSNSDGEDTDEMRHEVNQPKIREEVFEQLTKLREQPWPLRLRRQRKEELKRVLGVMGAKRFSIGPVVSAVESGGKKFRDILHIIDPMSAILKRIEGKHGASVVAVFNFIQDMIRLNLVLALLLLCGVVIPSSISVSEDTDQNYAWYSGGNCSSQPEDVCGTLKLMNDSWMTECHQNYVDKVQGIVNNHSTDGVALIQDFLQGTGFLEYTLLFSGYYPATVENGRYLISLAYLLTVLVTYVISLIFVVRSMAKFLKNISSSVGNYGMTFSKIVFTGWDFTIKESDAAKIESSLFISEVRAVFDDEDHNRRSLERTRNDKIKLYLGRFAINLVIMALIGGSWAGIYFLVKEAQTHTDETPFLDFIWEYAPTLAVAGLNIIFPLVFTFLVVYEQYKGRVELFVTLTRCVLVRLISLAILIISKVGLISNTSRECGANDEFVCWETYLGQQVYSVLILDAIIQIGMTFGVNVARWSLRRFDKALCQTIGSIEFFVPGHVLDVVYIQAVCWIGILYSPLIVSACLVYFGVLFFLKLFTVSVTCVPATRVFRASRSSAMFMTVLALAFLMCLVPNGLALLYLCPSLACSPFRGLGFAWQAVIYYICSLSGKTYWIRSFLFTVDDGIVIAALTAIVFITAVYYIALFSARGLVIKNMETKLKNANKDKNYLLKAYKNAQGRSTAR